MLYLSLPPIKALKRIIAKGLLAELSYDNFVVFGGKLIEDKYLAEIQNSSNDLKGLVQALHMPYDEMNSQIALSIPGMKRYIKWLNLAYRLEIKTVVVHTLNVDADIQNAYELNLEFMKILHREALDKGINIAVENRLEKNLFGSKPSDLVKLIEELGEGVGICLDLGHANINKNTEEFLTLSSYIIAIHAHDNDGSRDLHKPPFSGTVNWDMVEEWIRRTKFKGVIIFEVLCRDSATICDKVVEQIRLTPIANL
jgi:sugar phosphate isomerase/epimerase